MRSRKIPENPVYLMMNKKAGAVCSTVSDSHETVFDHIPQELLISAEGAKLHTVGRLDCDTEGLLLLTNDGKFSNFLTRPESRIEKTYLAGLKDPVDEKSRLEYTSRAAAGLVLPAEKKAPEQKSAGAVLEWQSPSFALITVTEGKFHEVKRIFRALGNEVVSLKRIKTGGLKLDESLKPGQFRNLTDEEVELLSFA